MARYLSDEWLRALDEAASENEALRQATRGTQLVVQERITDAPEGDTAYYVEVDDGTVTFHPGEHADPDVTFRQPYDIAVAIGRNETSAQAAFMIGKLTVTGDVGKLIEHHDAFTGIDDATDAVRARAALDVRAG